MGLVEQNLGAICQVEGAVAEILTNVVVFLFLDLLGSARGSTLAESLSNWSCVRPAHNRCDVWKSIFCPAGKICNLLIDELTADSGDVFDCLFRAGNDSLVFRLED